MGTKEKRIMSKTLDELTVNDIYALLRDSVDAEMGPFDSEEERIQTAILCTVEVSATQATSKIQESFYAEVKSLVAEALESGASEPALDRLRGALVTFGTAALESELMLREDAIRLAYRIGFELGHRQGILDHAQLFLKGA